MHVDNSLVIRRADESDAASLARLHIKAWQWAYRGQLPDTYLDALTASFDRRLEWRRELLASTQAEERTWVIEETGALVGFADTGPSHESDALAGAAVLHTIYLDEAAAGRGIGRMLIGYALEDLRQRGYASVTLWVLERNSRARRFYEAGGWHPDGATRIEHIAGMDVRELRYRIDLFRDNA